MRYQLRLQREPFDFSHELDNYDNGLFESERELEPEFDEFGTEFVEFEEEEEVSPRSRGAGPVGRGRPPPHRPRPPRRIIRPWRVAAGVIHGPSTCTCPEQTCPQHGSEYVRWAQSTLNRILGMRMPLNGVLTPATRSAIRSFQEREKLPVTGIVGPDTERALIAASNGQSPGAGVTKPDAPGMTEPAEPALTSPAAELEFEWEVAPLGQRETQRLTYSGQVVRFPSGEILRVVTGLPIGKHEDYWDPTGSGNLLLDTGPGHKDKKLSRSFTVRELTTSGGVSAAIARIDPKLVECLQRLRDHVGKGVRITSGFRSWKSNRHIYEKRGKTPTLSQHCGGRAADIHIARMNGLEIGKAAIDACGPKIGVGLGNTFAHIDVRGFAAAWNYGGVKDSWVAEIKRYQKEKGDTSRKPSTAGAKLRPAPSPSGSLTPPSDPSAYRKFRLTTYHVVDQADVPTGAVRIPIYDDEGRKIAEGSPAFFGKLSLEGTGRLIGDRLINVTGKTVRVSHDDYAEVLKYHRQAYARADRKRREKGKSPTPTQYSGIVVENGRVVRAFAFHEVTASKRGIGYGTARGVPYTPFRTLAADIGHTKYDKVDPRWKGKGGLVPPGTHVYIKEYDGLQLPDGKTHDGWFIVNDTGGAIFGAHFDVFTGTDAMRKQLKLPEFGQVWFAGIEQRIPRGYDYGLKA